MPTSSFPWRPLLLALLPFVLQWSFDQPDGSPHLDRFSLVPLFYAAVSAVTFHRAGLWLFQQDGEEHGPALAARMVTGIVTGVPLIFIIQWSALSAPEAGIVGFGAGNPMVSSILRVVGWGYRPIDNPLVGFVPA